MFEIRPESASSESAEEPTRAGAGRPVLVGGCPRSGTTLLRTMLNSHPHLAVPNETQFVVPAWRRREMFGDLSQPDNRRDMARWILRLRHARFDRIGIPEDELAEAFAAAPPTLGSVMATCFALYAERDGKVRWGDKRPSYSLNLNVVFGLFPNAQFVNVVRDPRGSVASMRKHWRNWGRLPSAVDTWERTDKSVQAALRKLRSDQITEVRYEDLIADPRATLEGVCDFLDLDPDGIPNMLAYHTGGDLPTGQMHANAAKPVSTQPLQRWRSELDDQDIAFVEHALADRLLHHGYEPSGVTARVSGIDIAELKQLRSRRDREERRRGLVELKRKVTYRRPTAAAPGAG